MTNELIGVEKIEENLGKHSRNTISTIAICHIRDQLLGHFDWYLYATSMSISFYAPTSKKLKGHIGLGLSICLSVTLSIRYTGKRSRTGRDRICRTHMKNNGTCIFVFTRSDFLLQSYTTFTT